MVPWIWQRQVSQRIDVASIVRHVLAAKILPRDAFLFGTMELDLSSFSVSIQKAVIPLP
jgi:hypothetical protein